jgi:hypothetical protein
MVETIIRIGAHRPLLNPYGKNAGIFQKIGRKKPRLKYGNHA